MYLTPLAKLDKKTAKIVRSVSFDCVSKVEEIMKSFHSTSMRANDLLKHDICRKFNDIRITLHCILNVLK